MKKIQIFLLCLCCTVIFSCSKKSEEIASQDTSSQNEVRTYVPKLKSYEPNTKNKKESNNDLALTHPLNIKTSMPILQQQPTATAHEKYLKDKMEFANFNYSDAITSTEMWTVVGSDEALFYEGATISSIDDLEKLESSIIVPIGTVLKIDSFIGKKSYDDDTVVVKYVKDGNHTSAYGTDLIAFTFQDEWNFFHETKYNGKKGLIFGADLITNSRRSETECQYISKLYTTNAKFDSFLPMYNSDDRIPYSLQQELAQNRIAFEEVPSDIEYIDDFIGLYKNTRVDSTFITTDLISHTKHVMFDEILQLIEESYLITKLKELIEEYSTILKNVNTENSTITATDETLRKAKDYFDVAKALLELAPTKVEAKYYYDEPEYTEKDFDEVLKQYSKTVKDEVTLIQEANGVLTSPLFSFADGTNNQEDYTQYKPRGHYTKNGILEAYFKAMMWFGRTHFVISEGSATNVTGTLTSELSKNMLPIALLITEITNKEKKVFEHWANIFDPVTVLVGASDDVSFYELLPFWREQNVINLKQWCENENHIENFLKEATSKITGPAIQGTSLYLQASDGTNENRSTPMGFRLFGQRYTLDAHIMTETTAPNVYPRTMTTALDVLACLGSEVANELLEQEYATYKDLKPTIQAFKNAIKESILENTFGKTYYETVLQEISTLCKFENGQGFYFTETPAWNVKQLNTQLGVLAELKHDTILYTKQSASEMGAGGPDITFRTKPIPTPINYVEPNLPFFNSVIISATMLKEVCTHYKFTGENNKIIAALERFIEMCTKLKEIVELEVNDMPISASQNDFLNPLYSNSVVSQAFRCMTMSYDPHSSSKQTTAIVADVFTDYDHAVALEFATGIPYKISVALNDGQGGKRIAVGYSFNSYEFLTNIDKRYNDDEWRKIVHTRSVKDLEKIKPQWLRALEK